MAGVTQVDVRSSDDTRLAASLLAQAFVDDPVVRWLQPDTRRHRRLFDALFRAGHGRRGRIEVAYCDGIPAGAAVWDAPPGFEPSARDVLRSLPWFIGAIGTRVRYGTELERLFAPQRPSEPHWYLAFLGSVTPGRGVGTSLLAAQLDRITGPAYLESSNRANIPLYERWGFEVTGEVVLPHDGPTVWPMYRPG